MSISNFNKAETRERKALNWFIDSKEEHRLIQVSEVGDKGHNDFLMSSGYTLIMGEVKIREYKSTDFETAIIDFDKIKRLTDKNKDLARLNNSQLFYLAFYPKSRDLYIFDIMNTQHTLKYIYCKETTMNDDSPWIYKTMAEFKFEDAIFKINY